MRPWGTLTGIASFLLVAPNLLWLAGLSPTWLPWLHLVSLGLVVRLLFLAAQAARDAGEVVWLGGWAGMIGGLVNQLILHLPAPEMAVARNLALWEGAGRIGSWVMAWDLHSLWWPFCYAVLLAFVFAAIAWGCYRAGGRRPGVRWSA
ncbi:MAG: hypothetical protein K6U14_00735 [Firmicutes bacterium]|nr:hypothetical protein [Alicyclobacillaceae bacterium]MCL6496144.1 hypothetical protein [Bacillota bacterium]